MLMAKYKVSSLQLTRGRPKASTDPESGCTFVGTWKKVAYGGVLCPPSSARKSKVHLGCHDFTANESTRASQVHKGLHGTVQNMALSSWRGEAGQKAKGRAWRRTPPAWPENPLPHDLLVDFKMAAGQKYVAKMEPW